MKCPSCGAEIGNTRKCEFCGSQISAEMQMEQERLNKRGCPQCGSSNITFKRENQGEVRGKNSKQVIHRTVGFCKDCGYTWIPNVATPNNKSSKTWLWVLGWIFIFPVPLTIILLRKKEMNKILKYGIIAVAWILYLILFINAGGSESTTNTNNTTSAQNDTSVVSSIQEENTIELVAGVAGEYGKEIVMSEGTDCEEHLVVYYVPAGKYTVKNLGEYMTQVNVYEGFAKNEETGYDEYTNTGDIIRLDINGEGEIEVPEGWFIEIHEPTHISLTAK